MNVNYQPVANNGQSPPVVLCMSTRGGSSTSSSAANVPTPQPRQAVSVPHANPYPAAPQNGGGIRMAPPPGQMIVRQYNPANGGTPITYCRPAAMPRVMVPNRAYVNKDGYLVGPRMVRAPTQGTQQIRYVHAGPRHHVAPQPGMRHIRPLFTPAPAPVANGQVSYAVQNGRYIPNPNQQPRMAPSQIRHIKVDVNSAPASVSYHPQPRATYIVRSPYPADVKPNVQQLSQQSPNDAGSVGSPSNGTEDASPPPVSHTISLRDNAQLGISIGNVVCNYVLPMHIDLKLVARTLWNTRYQQDAAVLMMQHRNPECHAKISSSGKVYIVGTRSEDDSRRAARTIARKIQKVMQRGHNKIPLKKFRISNILATCRLPFGVLIAEMARKYPSQCEYEPELTVGLIYRSVEPKATLRIHTTGSITVTGATSKADVDAVLAVVYEKALEFRCDPSKATKAPTRKRNTVEVNMGLGSIKRRRRNSDAEDDVAGVGLMFEDEADLFDDDAL